jgi:hypothetical protein
VIARTEAGHMRAQHLGGLPHAVAVQAVDPKWVALDSWYIGGS